MTFRAMKIFVLFLALFVSVSALPAATAYQALQYFANSRGDDVLNHVMVVRGEGGGPQPEEWIVYRGRANAPFFQASGIKASGVVLSGTAPARVVALQPHALPLNFSVLNLDSNAAWKIARREARKDNFPFDRVDYELKTNSIANVPAWTLRLFNEKKGLVGELTLSAATGDVLRPLELHRFLVEDVDGQPELVTVREPWLNRAMRSVGRWFNQTGSVYGKDLLRAAGTAEEILVEQRTRDYTEDVN